MKAEWPKGRNHSLEKSSSSLLIDVQNEQPALLTYIPTAFIIIFDTNINKHKHSCKEEFVLVCR
jgi:hypothetical protein